MGGPQGRYREVDGGGALSRSKEVGKRGGVERREG